MDSTYSAGKRGPARLFAAVVCLALIASTAANHAQSADLIIQGISGHVTDARSGAGIGSVHVVLQMTNGWYGATAVTDAQGVYTFSGLPVGGYLLYTTNTSGYVDQVYNRVECFPALTCNPYRGDAVIVAQATMTSNIDFPLVPGGRIAGHVANPAGTLMPRQTVRIFNSNGTWVADAGTDASGAYVSWRPLKAGSYFAETWNLNGYVNKIYDNVACMKCIPIYGTPILVTEGATTPGIDFVIGPRLESDFDGDGRSDRTIFRPSTGDWFAALSGGAGAATNWGVSGDVDVAADYDGDGKTDIAVWRPSSGWWYIVYSKTGTANTIEWGMQGDIPLAGDIDADGRADLVVFRPATGTWYIRRATGETAIREFGMAGDRPLLGDFNGDGGVDYAIFRPSTGVWYVAYSGGGNSVPVSWGQSGDVPIVGDWDGDGRADYAVFRPATAGWFIKQSYSGTTLTIGWGDSGDIPVVGDWDGDGKSDFTVWRPTIGVWFTQSSSGGSAVVNWGIPGDKPIGRPPAS